MSGEERPKSPRGRDVKKLPKPWVCRKADYTFEDGWTMEEVPPEDFKLESFFVGHCLGRDNTYVDGVKKGTTRVLSLREPDGTPHVTVVMSPWGYATGKHERLPTVVSQACGRGNASPAKKYDDRLVIWAKAKGYTYHTSGYHGDNDSAYHESGCMDGRWVGAGENPFHGPRLKELPANLQEAMADPKPSGGPDGDPPNPESPSAA